MRLFGFTFASTFDNGNENIKSFVPPSGTGSTITVQSGLATGGSYAIGMDDHAYLSIESENALIKKYREVGLIPEVDFAVNEIQNDAIVTDETEDPVWLNLDDLQVNDKIKEIIHECFEEILELLEFKENGPQIFRNWYVDGRIYYHMLIDEKNYKDGIQQLRYIDPRLIKRVREYKKEVDLNNMMISEADYKDYYMYSRGGVDNKRMQVGTVGMEGQSVLITLDSIQYQDSGIYDKDGLVVLSNIHKAIRPANNLKNMEDAMMIYRLSRAPERRAFYIDVGNLPKAQAEQYMNQIMQKHRNKIVYDPATGEIKDSSRIMALTEDYWLPRRDGSRGTDIQTLPGAQNLSATEDVEYFKQALYRALNVPMSRFNTEGQSIFGRGTEISRDELRFGRFVSSLRQKFNHLFYNLLGRQLVLKGVMTADDFDRIKRKIKIEYLRDNHFTELVENEILSNRIAALRDIEPYIGMFFSKEYVYENIIRMTEEEVEIEKMRMKNEESQGEVEHRIPGDQGGDEFAEEIPGGQPPVGTPKPKPAAEKQETTQVKKTSKTEISSESRLD